jgi:hypothetical protein
MTMTEITGQAPSFDLGQGEMTVPKTAKSGKPRSEELPTAAPRRN